MSTALPALTLGERVRVSHTLHRETQSRKPPGALHEQRWRVWEPTLLGNGPLDGIVIGVRTYADGEVVTDYHDMINQFRPRRHYPVVLVVFDIRQKSVSCLPKHLEKISS